jgi:hypothetical protein
MMTVEINVKGIAATLETLTVRNIITVTPIAEGIYHIAILRKHDGCTH